MADGPDSPLHGPRPWPRAWGAAAHEGRGFWSDGAGSTGPATHFRTSAHVGATLARAFLVLLREVDARLGGPSTLDVVDVGAGRGELLAGLLGLAEPTLAERLRAVGVDLLPRPAGLDPRIAWVQGAAPDAVPREVRGLLVAHEWLDELPVDVVVADDEGVLRTVLVDGAGAETTSGDVDPATSAWLERWWPDVAAGDRAEAGPARDAAWLACVRRLAAGTALAVDYGHVRDERTSGRFGAGTLVGYRDGRLTSPVPDGSTNLTAHVAFDSLVAALDDEPGASVVLSRQREALRSLGVSAVLPPSALARKDPQAYVDALEEASYASELLDPAGLGAFRWLRVDR